MALDGNIFYEIHSKLWDLLEAKTTFTAAVKSANRIKFTGAIAGPIPELASASTMPSVMIWNAGTTRKSKDRAASNATRLEVQWEVVVKTGNQPYDPFFTVQEAIFAALLNWDTTMTAITWGTENPVKDCNLLSSKDSLLDKKTDLNIRGWKSVWVGVTDCWFNHNNLQAVS